MRPGRSVLRASVIVINHNDLGYLEGCLRSLQATLTDCEVILVDNASQDSSVEYVRQTFPAVKVIRSPVNGSFGWGCNLGAQWARGRYLVFLNPDTKMAPDWLETLLAVLDADPQAGLATPQILLMADPGRINTCGNQIHCTGLTMCRGLGLERDALADIHEVPAISGAAFAVRREVFAALRGFDEAFFLYMDDADLSWRARLSGYRCLYAPHSVVYHDYRLRFGSRNKTFYQERNRYLMLLKCLRWRTLLALLPALCLGEVVTWGFVLLHDRQNWRNKLQSYAWVLRHWAEVMENRRRVQASRKVSDRDLIAPCTYGLAYEQADNGRAARWAHVLFDPLFLALHRMALLVIRC